MAKSMTENQLKKKLSTLEKEQLLDIICALYKENNQVKHYLNDKYQENYGIELLEKYKKKLDKCFFSSRVLSLIKAKDIINEFSQCTLNKTLIADLKLLFVEYSVEYTNMYGDINEKFYDVTCEVFSDVVSIVSSDENLYNKLKYRLTNMIESIPDIGWAFQESMIDIYYEIPWIEDEEGN